MSNLPMRPFRYLQERVGPEADEFARAALQGNRGAEGGQSRDAILAEARLRVGGQAQMGRDDISRIAENAFDARDARTRGAGWWLLADLHRRAGQTADVAMLFKGLLSTRFGIDPTFEGLETAARAWLDGVVHQVDAAERKLRSETTFNIYVQRFAEEDKREIEKNAAPFLEHADPGRRLAAIAVMRQAADTPAWFPAKLRDMALSDADVRVRASALTNYAGSNFGCRDAEILSFLAGLALDESQPSRVRYMAYDGLFVVLGKPSPEWPTSKAMLESREAAVAFFSGSDVWPSEIDWPFVKSFVGAGT